MNTALKIKLKSIRSTSNPVVSPYRQFLVYNSNPDAPTHRFSGVGWQTPVAGNLLILAINAGSTITTVADGTWTKDSTLVNDTETSIYRKTAAGTETPPSITASGSCTAQMAFIEIPGYTTFDQQVTDTGGIATGGVFAFGTTSTTTAANEVAIAVAGADLSTPTGDPRPTKSWANGFTGLSNQGAANGSGPPYNIMMGVAIKILTATGTITTTWTFKDPTSTVGVFNSLIATYK